MNPELLKVVSSQYKHLPGRTAADIDPRTLKSASMLTNDMFSFQALYRAEEGVMNQPVSLTAVCEGLRIGAWRVDYVPILYVCNPKNEPGYESDKPGLYPDVLMPRPAAPEVEGIYEKDTLNLLNATGGDYQAVWFTVNPDSTMLTAGEYTIRIALTALLDGTLLAEQELKLEVIDAALPESDVYYTNWFYEDVLCDTFDVELYSDKFYEIFDDYVSNMARHRQNTLLLPAFTPPLDTPVGSERMNVQLTDIRRDENGWHFGFERMRTFVRHALRCGIRTFEHCHLFSQWGAEHAPNIYDTTGKRIFGFDTDAFSEEYVTFIRSYLKAFFAFAKEEGIENHLFFHISDEPVLDQLESYRKAVSQVADLLEGYVTADAMSRLEFYTEGLVKQPIASVRSADSFMGKCDSFWLYYTGGVNYEKLGGTNRLMTNTAARTRVLGVQMFHYKALGFLHWGYNFYYDRLSAGRFVPQSAPNAYKNFPGAAHLVYPVFGRGVCHVATSIREKLMAEAMDDLRALKLLASRIGFEAVDAMCERILGHPAVTGLVPEGDALLKLREAINQKIRETN